jgi:hypothetical protein
MSKGPKPNRTTASVPPGNAPYDPLDLRTLAESMAKVVLEQPVHPLAKVPAFEGAVIYVIYYTGSHEPYKSIAQKYKNHKREHCSDRRRTAALDD